MLAFLAFKLWLVHCLYDVTSWCVTPPWPVKHYSWWRRDVNFPNTEFQSFLSRWTVRLSSECNQICSSTSQCQFATFNNFTRECKTYAALDGPVHVTNTSLWKAYLQIDAWPYAHFGHIRLSFKQGNKFCTDFGGHLALPDTDAEMQKIKQILGQKQGVSDCWIGGMKSENGWEMA
ncbi:uncharacterized protein LOC117340461 [Pecten maximus]|uniref:uncharacterized protein LOC117340461 n=1 Tax=Pecten maximus TaxID=6579 RepID=UPI001458824A|nr:uncharacterized protein LOC117340461 [Pecten maximus]